MHLTSTLALIATLASSYVVRADVVPSEPSPGSVYREGQSCPITWGGDTSSPTLWKNMNIELMTGDNFNMIHLTTVATGQDGTVSGQFQYPCPDVTVNSAIYFYQFTSPTATNKTWTTRFTIADANGATTPPANALEPGTNAPIPWGVGALADPSKGTPPPPNGGGGGGGGAAVPNSVSASGPVLAASSSLPAPTTSAVLTTSSLIDDTPTPSAMVTVVASSGSALSSAPSSSPSSSASNSATGMSAMTCMTSLILSAFTFVLFL